MVQMSLKKMGIMLCMAAALLLFSPAVTVHAKTMYTTDTVRMRKEPSRSGEIITTLGPVTEVVVYGYEGEWADASYNDKNGYICKDYLTSSEKKAKKALLGEKKKSSKSKKKSSKTKKKTAKSSKKEKVKGTAKINATDVNFRKKPKGEVICQLDKGEKLKIYSTSGDWTKVKISDGRKGYVYTSYIGKMVSRTDRIAGWKKKAVKFCKKNLDAKYSQEKRDEEGYFDCSSLMRDAFLYATGKKIGETTYSQTEKMKKYMYQLDSIYDASYGDIVYHLSGENENHCGIYLGDGQVLNASQTAGKVKIKTFEDWSTYWEYGCKAADYCYDKKYK